MYPIFQINFEQIRTGPNRTLINLTWPPYDLSFILYALVSLSNPLGSGGEVGVPYFNLLVLLNSSAGCKK